MISNQRKHESLVSLMMICLFVQAVVPQCMENHPDFTTVYLTASNRQDGQSFTACGDGQLTSFTIVFGSPNAGLGNRVVDTINARVFAGANWPANAGAPGAPFIAEANAVTAGNEANGTPLTFTFTPPATVMGGSVYTVRVVGTTTAPNGNHFYRHADAGTDTYANGDFYRVVGDQTSAGTSFTNVDITFSYNIAAAAPPAAATGDPHFVGLHNQHFDFIGRANTVYNLLSSVAFQVNSFFSEMEIFHGYFDGIFMQQVSVQTHGLLPGPVVIDAGNSSFVDEPTMRIGGALITPAPLTNNTTRPVHVFVSESIKVTWTVVETTAKELGFEQDQNDRIVRIATIDITNKARLQVMCVENGFGKRGDRLIPHTPTARRNLDIRVQLFDTQLPVHGVLGSTNNPLVQRPPGVDADYEVKDGLFGTDFVHNLYHK